MKQAILALRIGLSFVMLYASIDSLLSPKDWLWFIPDWLIKVFPNTTILLNGHGIFELILGIWLLSGRKTYYAAIFICLDMLSISLLNISVLQTVFRDIGLFSAALALVFLTRTTNKSSKKK